MLPDCTYEEIDYVKGISKIKIKLNKYNVII